jgi:hypothetical protein
MIKYPSYPLPHLPHEMRSLFHRGEKHVSIPLVCLKKSLKKETFKKRLILFKVKPLAPLPARRAYRPEASTYAPEGAGEKYPAYPVNPV